MPDAELLRRTLDAVERAERARRYGLLLPDQPRWDQGNWRHICIDCGTAYCFAGWVAVLEDRPWSTDPDLYDTHVIDEQGHLRHVSDWAAGRLGITEEDADLLFGGGLGLETLRSMVDWLADHADLVDWLPDWRAVPPGRPAPRPAMGDQAPVDPP